MEPDRLMDGTQIQASNQDRYPFIWYAIWFRRETVLCVYSVDQSAREQCRWLVAQQERAANDRAKGIELQVHFANRHRFS